MVISACISETAVNRVKYVQFLPLGENEGFMHKRDFWNFFHRPSFMLKYGNFENHPVSRIPLSIEQKYVQFWPLG